MIINEYFQVKESLEQLTSEQSSVLSELDLKLSREKCPTHDETSAILYSIKAFSLGLADYLEKMRELSKAPATIMNLRNEPNVEIVISKQCLRTLSQPYSITINLSNSFFEKVSTSKHWDRVFDVVQWYEYFGSSFSRSSSLIALVWSAKRCFDDKNSDIKLIELYCQLIASKVHDKYLTGFKHISNRATFLLQEKDDIALEAGNVNWWCDKIDSSAFDYEFRYLLKVCPKPHDERVISKLNQLLDSNTKLSQKILEQISSLVKNGG